MAIWMRCLDEENIEEVELLGQGLLNILLPDGSLLQLP